MSAIRNYAILPSPDRILLIRAASLVALIRLGLWAIPFNILYRLLGSYVRSPGLITYEG